MALESTVVVFDVNGTLSNLAPMARRFAEVGAPWQLAEQWFGRILRDGFALTAAGGQESFVTIAEGLLPSMLTGVDLNRDVETASGHIMAGFDELPVHSDVVAGVRGLRAAGARLVTLSNGATTVADRLLGASGIRAEFEALYSVEDAPAWKPARVAYRYAEHACGCEPAQMLLVAAHPWDIHGAAAAGWATAWLNRDRQPYPAHFTPPTHTVTALTELPGKLRAR